MSSVRTKSVDCGRADGLPQRRPSPHRRAEPPRGRQHGAPARLGAPLRPALADPHGGRVPALRRRGRAARAADAAAPRRRRLGRRGCAPGAARVSRSRPAPRPAMHGARARSAQQLREALDRFDDAGAHAAFDEPAVHVRGRDRAARRRAARTSTSWASAGSAARCRSRRSTSRARCCAGGCSGSRAAGATRGSPLALLACVPGRPARPRADLLRPRPAPPRLADHLPRARTRRSTRRRDDAPARAGARRPHRDHGRLRDGGARRPRRGGALGAARAGGRGRRARSSPRPSGALSRGRSGDRRGRGRARAAGP